MTYRAAKILDQHQAESYDKSVIQIPGVTAGLSETYRVESRRGFDEKMFFAIFTPWPSTKILADPGLEPALVEPISFTFPDSYLFKKRSGI